MPMAELLNASNGFGAWAPALTGADRNATVQSTSAARVRVVGERGLIGGMFVGVLRAVYPASSPGSTLQWIIGRNCAERHTIHVTLRYPGAISTRASAARLTTESVSASRTSTSVFPTACASGC